MIPRGNQVIVKDNIIITSNLKQNIFLTRSLSHSPYKKNLIPKIKINAAKAKIRIHFSSYVLVSSSGHIQKFNV